MAERHKGLNLKAQALDRQAHAGQPRIIHALRSGSQVFRRPFNWMKAAVAEQFRNRSLENHRQPARRFR